MFLNICLSVVNLSIICPFVVHLMGDKKFWETYAWIKRGKQRREVIILLPEKPFIPQEFRKKINETGTLKLSLREMSRHLTSFTKQGLTMCLTPKSPYGRLYSITSFGHRIKKEIES